MGNHFACFARLSSFYQINVDIIIHMRGQINFLYAPDLFQSVIFTLKPLFIHFKAKKYGQSEQRIIL